MIVVLIILSLGLLGVIIYFAVSPKSSRLLRLSAIIALGVIGLALIICGIIILIGPAEDEDVISFPVFPDISPPVKKINNVSDIIILAVLLLFVGFVMFRAMKEQKKTAAAAQKKAEKSPIFHGGDVLEIDLESKKGKKDDDESFDIEL